MTLPQNRKPLSLSQFQGPRYDSQGRRILHSHPSTWQQEVEKLQDKVTELAMLVLAAESQAEEAYQAQLSAEAAASWGDIRANQAINEAKALRARVATLEAALGEVMVGGNHLALIIGPDHLPYTEDHETALNHYGVGPQYDAWCCWQAIMKARAALQREGGNE